MGILCRLSFLPLSDEVGAELAQGAVVVFVIWLMENGLFYRAGIQLNTVQSCRRG